MNGLIVGRFDGLIILKGFLFIVVDGMRLNTSTHQSVHSPDPLYLISTPARRAR